MTALFRRHLIGPGSVSGLHRNAGRCGAFPPERRLSQFAAVVSAYPRHHTATEIIPTSPYLNSHPASAKIAFPQSRRPSGSKSAGVGTAFRNTNNRSSLATVPRADLADRPPVTRPRVADSVCCRWFINLIVLSRVKPSQLRLPYLATPSHRQAHCSRMAGAARNRSASRPRPAPAGPDSTAVSVKIIVVR